MPAWGSKRANAQRASEATSSVPDRPAGEAVRHGPEAVQLDGLALLRVIRHCTETLPELCSGSLLGLDVDRTLQITNSFPFPRQREGEEDGSDYQMEMMKLLRDVNVDNNCVGWYRSTYMGSFCTADLIEQQYNYQTELDHKAVVLIYDPFQTARGTLAVRAYRLSDRFMETYRKYKASKSAHELDLSADGILDEVPIQIHNSNLQHVLLNDLRETNSESLDVDFDRLDLSSNPYLEKNLESLVEEVDNLAREQQQLAYAERNLNKQRAGQAKWLAQRKAENKDRVERGEPALPEEDPTNPLFQATPMPSKLESLLIRNQIGVYCEQMNKFSGTSFNKMFLASALQSKSR